MHKDDPVEDLGILYNGCHLYRKPNEVGGHIYFSDEIGGGVMVWDTALASEGTLLAAICCEHNRKYIEHIRRTKPDWEPTPEMLMERSAATGGLFVPRSMTDINAQEEQDLNADDK